MKFDGLLSIVVPVYNEEATIINILKLIEEVPVKKEVIVVDDYSTDNSREKLRMVSPNVRVLLHDRNMGKGAAIRTGLRHAIGDALIVQDADLEYNPQDYLRLLDEFSEQTPVVYGSRFLGNISDMSRTHLLGNRLLTGMTNLLYGSHLTDMETCYKLMGKEVYNGLGIKSNRFNVEPEITAKILKMGWPIVEIPISYKGRNFDEGKKISWRDGFGAMKTLIRMKFSKIEETVNAVEEGSRVNG